jgi:hypothetical protein
MKGREKKKTIGCNDNIHRNITERNIKSDVIGTVITRPTEIHIHRTRVGSMNEAHAG